MDAEAVDDGENRQLLRIHFGWIAKRFEIDEDFLALQGQAAPGRALPSLPSLLLFHQVEVIAGQPGQSRARALRAAIP